MSRPKTRVNFPSSDQQWPPPVRAEPEPSARLVIGECFSITRAGVGSPLALTAQRPKPGFRTLPQPQWNEDLPLDYAPLVAHLSNLLGYAVAIERYTPHSVSANKIAARAAAQTLLTRIIEPRVAALLRRLPPRWRTIRTHNRIAAGLSVITRATAETPSLVPYLLAHLAGLDRLQYPAESDQAPSIGLAGTLKQRLRERRAWDNRAWRWLCATDDETAEALLALGDRYPDHVRICADAGLPPNGILTRIVLAAPLPEPALHGCRRSVVHALAGCHQSANRADRAGRHRITTTELPDLLRRLRSSPDRILGELAHCAEQGLGWARLVEAIDDDEGFGGPYLPTGDYTWPNPLPRLWVNDCCFLALDSSRALLGETRAMGHCVAIYDRKCRCGEARIYSARDRHGQRIATVELNPTEPHGWTVGQISGPHNEAAPRWLAQAAQELARIHSERTQQTGDTKSA